MKNDLICWDSSVLIDHIKGNDKDRIKNINMVVESIEQGRHRLVVSTLVYVEVLESAMPDGAIEKFRHFMQSKEKVEIVAVDICVAEKAQVIRNRSRKSISVPDAIHVATAIVSRAKVFHTFDKSLLSLNGKDVVEGLAITACEISGMSASLFD